MFWLIYGIMFIFRDQGLNFYSCYVAIKYGRDIWWTLEQNWVNRISSPFSIMIDVNLFNDNSKRKTSQKWLTVAIWLSWTVMDFHGWLSRMTFMDDWHGCLAWMTFMDDWHGWLAWMTGMDYPRLLIIADLSYFHILFSYGLTDRRTYIGTC